MHQTRKHALCRPKHIIASHIKSIKAHICQTRGILHPFSGSQLERCNKNCCSHLPEIAVKVWGTPYILCFYFSITNKWKLERQERLHNKSNPSSYETATPWSALIWRSLAPAFLSISLWKHSGIPFCYCLHCSPTHTLTLTLTKYLAC